LKIFETAETSHHKSVFFSASTIQTNEKMNK